MNLSECKQSTNIYSIFNRFFGIQREEFKLVNLFLIYLTILYTAYTIITTAALSLFLGRISSDILHQLLPLLYIAIAVVITVVAKFYQKLIDNFTRIKLITWTTIFFIISFLCLRILITLFQNQTFIYALLMIWDETSCTVLVMVFYSFLGDYFYVHNARRLYAYITGGLALGAPLGGFGASALLNYISTPNLIYIGAILHAIAIAVAYFIYTTQTSKKPQINTKRLANPIFFKRLFTHKYLWFLFAVGACPLVFSCIDSFQMASIANKTLNEKQLGHFMGQFYGYIGLTLLVIDFVLAKWIQRASLLANLLIMPVLLMFACVGFLANPILIYAALIKFVDNVLSNTVNTFAFQVLYLPLSDRVRMHAQAMSVGVMASSAKILGGGILVILSSLYVSSRIYTVILLAIALIWVVFTFILIPFYKKELTTSLSKISLDPSDLERLLDQPNSKVAIKKLLTNSNTQTIITVLKTLTPYTFIKNKDTINTLLSHPDSLIAATALNSFGTYGDMQSSQLISGYLLDNREEIQAAAIKAYARIEKEAALDKIKEFFNSPTKLIIQTSVISAYKYCGTLGKRLAIERIKTLLKNDQQSALFIITQTGANEFKNDLINLLVDNNEAIREEAINASVHFSDKKIIENLIINLDNKMFKTLAERALYSLPKKAIDEIVNQYSNMELSVGTKYILLIAMSKIDPQKAMVHIIDVIESNSSPLLVAATYHALVQMDTSQDIPHDIKNKLKQVREQIYQLVLTLRSAYREMKDFPQIMNKFFADSIYFYASIMVAILSIEYKLKQLIQLRELLLELPEQKTYALIELLETILPKKQAKEFKSVLLPPISKDEFVRDYPSKENVQKLMKNEWLSSVISYSFEKLKTQNIKLENGFPMKTKHALYYEYIETIAFLKQVELFKNVPVHFLVPITELIYKQNYQASECIFKEDENSNSLFIIQTGVIQIQKGGKEIIRLGAGEYFGELALLDNLPHEAKAYSLEESKVLRLDSEDFEKILETYPEVSEALLKVLVQKLRKVATNLTEM